MEDVSIFYGHLVHFMVFCYILETFGTVRGNFVYFSRFGILYKEKSGNPARGAIVIGLGGIVRSNPSRTYLGFYFFF
jgi:hypothetical protein